MSTNSKHYSTPTREALKSLGADGATVEDLLGPEPELTFTVVHADLSKYADRQLEGRLAHYEREYLFERDARLRNDFKIEVDKTKAEIRRRQLMRFEEAERAFTE